MLAPLRSSACVLLRIDEGCSPRRMRLKGEKRCAFGDPVVPCTGTTGPTSLKFCAALRCAAPPALSL